MTANALHSLRTSGKKSLGTPRRRKKGIIKIDLQDVGWGRGAWTGFPRLKLGTVDGPCQCSDKHSGSQNAEILLTI